MADEPDIVVEDTDESSEFSTVADDPRFRSDEMVACRACSRTNPPNRVACLYCGSDLEIAELLPEAVKLSFQSPEAWEDGFTISYCGYEEREPDATAGAAEILRLDRDVLSHLVHSRSPAPVAYLRSLAEAQILADRLTKIEFPCAIAGDDLLIPRTPPSRLRGIEFNNTEVTFQDFNTGTRFAFAGTDRMLLVSGVICKTRSETTSKRSKRSMKVTDAAEALTDEAVLDIYPPSDVFGFRVRPTGFDFSCLGDKMQKTGAENLRILTRQLLERFPASKLVDVYPSIRSFLNEIWPIGLGDRSSTISRVSFGGVRIQQVALIDNTTQFTRFSRLQRHLI